MEASRNKSQSDESVCEGGEVVTRERARDVQRERAYGVGGIGKARAGGGTDAGSSLAFSRRPTHTGRCGASTVVSRVECVPFAVLLAQCRIGVELTLWWSHNVPDLAAAQKWSRLDRRNTTLLQNTDPKWQLTLFCFGQ
ncbi:hypothetical protein EVAR_74282_1 [Eumeta japonica]|uniref:Uncharacterized protein n=1 Tax=Eumeta variegata TaxID=151549 RepID=A0A4C1SCW8_EUMVA|nr:hypothetical protein EVAR_74282_1 [Eumeta japonica]